MKVDPTELRRIAEDRVSIVGAALHHAADEIEWWREWHQQQRDLVRRLDVALNGDGAAKQASLCDLVAQFEKH